MRDLVFISLESWDDIWRRNQFVCAELARRYPQNRILFITPPRDVSNAVRRLKLSQLTPRPVWSPESLPNIHVFQPDKLFPNTLEPTRRLNIAFFRRQFRSAIARLQLRNPLLWINDHSLHELVGSLGESGCVYDITDDWISFSQAPFLRERVRRQDAALCRKAGAVIVCSEGLRKLKSDLVPESRLHLIPNGVDAAHYARVLDALPSHPLPAAAQAWAKPVYGYTGSLHADRVDLKLVRDLASRLTGTLVFVGPNFLTPDQQRDLTSGLTPGSTAQIILHGPVPYRDLPDYMRAFDACLVPHLVSDFTESLNPIKLWEYLAAGKPIVSTPVAGFRDFAHLLSLASTPQAMAAALRDTASEPPERARLRREEARQHSWQARVDQIEAVLRSLTPEKAAVHTTHPEEHYARA